MGAALHVGTVALYQLSPLQSPPMAPSLGNIAVLCALWEDGSPALLLPIGTGMLPSHCTRSLLCVFGEKALQGALFYVFIERGRLVTFTLALGVWSVLVSGKGRLLWGLRRRGH